MALSALMLFGVFRLTSRWLDQRQRRIEGGDPADLADLRAELAGLDELRSRVLELEERVDFAERLLAQRPDRGQLGANAPRKE